jgi:hypothetical protein
VSLDQTLLSMQSSEGFYKGVQLDAAQVRAMLAHIDAQDVEVGRLRAEVERMRAELHACGRAKARMHDTATSEERTAVVAWLREPGEYVDPACARLADCIERGVHRKETT